MNRQLVGTSKRSSFVDPRRPRASEFPQKWVPVLRTRMREDIGRNIFLREPGSQVRRQNGSSRIEGPVRQAVL